MNPAHVAAALALLRSCRLAECLRRIDAGEWTEAEVAEAFVAYCGERPRWLW